MSRTDKDAPAWVRTLGSTRAHERHAYGCVHSPYRSTNVPERVCDIDTRDGRCYRWDRDHHGTWDLRPTNEMVLTDCHARERAEVREVLRAALRDYNTNGDTDIEPVRRQRGQATWSGYYFH